MPSLKDTIVDSSYFKRRVEQVNTLSGNDTKASFVPRLVLRDAYASIVTKELADKSTDGRPNTFEDGQAGLKKVYTALYEANKIDSDTLQRFITEDTKFFQQFAHDYVAGRITQAPSR